MGIRDRYPDASSGLESDSIIHRRHNINTNFDNLEISPPFTEACREALNRGIVNLIDAHEFNLAYAMGNADVLRLRDPTDSLVRIVSRPERIEWLSFADSQEDFLNFRDLDQAITSALRSRDGFTRLFEYSEPVSYTHLDVYKRQDYQFSEILLPLKLAHKTDPAGSLQRIREQFELSHQLEGTGAGKQVAIALEGLLELVAHWYPTKVFHGPVSYTHLHRRHYFGLHLHSGQVGRSC